MKRKKNNLVDLESFINDKYGERGTKDREYFEGGYEALKLGIMLQELRKEMNMTQEQLHKSVEQPKHIFQELKTMLQISGFLLLLEL